MTRALSTITVAPNGARRGLADHPALPVSIDAVAATAAACHAAGAGTIHLHVRDDAGAHSLDAQRYVAAIRAVEAATGGAMGVQITTEAAGCYDVAAQRALLEQVAAQAASVALRELVPDPSEEAATAAALTAAAERGIALQYILYEPGEIAWLADLVVRGVVPAGFEVLFVMGRYDAGGSDPERLVDWLWAWQASGLAGQAPWMVCAFGPSETRVLAAALALGGKARVGFENNLHRPDGTVAADNAERVAAIAGLAAAMGLRGAH